MNPSERRDPARATALRLLYRLEAGDGPLDRLLAQLDGALPASRDRRLARHLVLGCLRWQKRLDWIAGQFIRKAGEPLPPWPRLLLRLGLYQLFWLDRVPGHAAVNTSVELAKRFTHRGIAALVNAILRRAQREADRIRYPCRLREPVAYLAVFHSHPEWLVERWLERWGPERTEALLRANNAQAPVCIRMNRVRGEPAALAAALESEGFALAPAGPLPGYFAVADSEGLFRSRAYDSGDFQVQDGNAGLPAVLLAPRPGERVLDLCSAPGGKTTQLAALMGNQGLVLAADAVFGRLARVRENSHRLSLSSIRLVVQDARYPAVFDRTFARILVDAPCSATGVLGRRPDVRWRRTANQLPALAARQLEILARAFSLLPPGGVLVYSTCSLEEEENERLVERFLRQACAAELEPADRFFPDRPWAGRYLQTLPGREPGDGCFAARIRRREP